MNTRTTRNTLALVLGLSSAIAACSGEKKSEGGDDPGPTGFVTPTADPNAHPYVQEAQVKYPRLLDLQTKVISTTCSPNPNVCHNSSSFPNLETAGNTLANVNAPCNVELPDRTQGWDSCERPADLIRAGLDFSSRVAWVEKVGPLSWRVGFEQAPAITGSRRPEFRSPGASGAILLSADDFWGVTIALVTGTAEAMVTVDSNEFTAEVVSGVMDSLNGGNPNGNSVWGGDDDSGVDEGALFSAGSRQKSYLWGRITGTVPGSRMPLANAPLTNAAYAAIACWIEGLAGDGSDDPEDLIDYDGCAYADAPEDHQVN